jgi:hypothetical protein
VASFSSTALLIIAKLCHSWTPAYTNLATISKYNRFTTVCPRLNIYENGQDLSWVVGFFGERC